MPIPQQTEIAYLAGILAGEGSISARRVRNRAKSKSGNKIYYVVDFRIFNTFEPLIDWIVEKFGGYKMSQVKKNPNAKTLHIWSTRNIEETREMIACLRPHLRIKHRQADAALGFLEMQIVARKTHNAMYDKIARRGEVLVSELRSLNQSRGRKDSVRALQQ